VSIFGFGETPDTYKSIPNELFFHNDYHKVVRERNTVIDQRTKLPPHFMPYGYLTNILGLPHDLEAQRRVPGRADLTQEELSSRFVQIDGNTRINDGLSEIAFQTANLTHKELVPPLSDALLEYESLKLIIFILDIKYFSIQWGFCVKNVYKF